MIIIRLADAQYAGVFVRIFAGKELINHRSTIIFFPVLFFYARKIKIAKLQNCKIMTKNCFVFLPANNTNSIKFVAKNPHLIQKLICSCNYSNIFIFQFIWNKKSDNKFRIFVQNFYLLFFIIRVFCRIIFFVCEYFC